MATYWENSCSFGLRYVSWYKYLIVSLVFSHLGFWSGNLFLIAPFPDLCLLVPFHMLCITWLHICMQKLLLVLRGERYSIKMFPNYYIFHTKIDCFSPKFRSCGTKHGKQIVLSNSALFREVNLCIRAQMVGFLFFQKP